MKRVTVTLLVFNVFTPTVFGQIINQKETTVFPSRVEIIRGTDRHYENIITPTAEQTDLQRLWSGWLQKVEGAERDYKKKNGHFGDLGALRKAQLLRSLVFELRSSAAASGKAKANFAPKSTLIQVTVSEDGQHFDAMIVDGAGHCQAPLEHSVPLLQRDFEDSPQYPTRVDETSEYSVLVDAWASLAISALPCRC